jgi:transcriptional regulator with XRE-family HTH domain
MKQPTDEQLASFRRNLGDELRTARKKRGWTRKQMCAHLKSTNKMDEVSLQTLATYELGTRRATIERLVVLCAVLGQEPDALLRRAWARTFGTDRQHLVRIDLAALASTSDPRLHILQPWATVRIEQCTDGQLPIAELDVPALTALANVANTTLFDLFQALRDLAQTR